MKKLEHIEKYLNELHYLPTYIVWIDQLLSTCQSISWLVFHPSPPLEEYLTNQSKKVPKTKRKTKKKGDDSEVDVVEHHT